MSLIPILTDESPMPFGKYKGKKMEDVPAWYLLKIWDGEPYGTDNDKAVRNYIEDNLDVLYAQTKQSRFGQRNYSFNPYR